jgi:hypothetical protein
MYESETLDFIKHHGKILKTDLNKVEKVLHLLSKSICDYNDRFLYDAIVEFIIENLSQKYNESVPLEERKIMAVGQLVSNYFEWDSRILEAFQEALTDANFHTESAVIEGWVTDIQNDKVRDYFSNYRQICENLVKLDGMQLNLVDSRYMTRQEYINIIKIAIKNNGNVVKKLTEYHINLDGYEREYVSN